MIKLLTYTHILAGIISLIVAPLAMVVRKGGNAHRLWGKIFFWCMTWIFLSAIILSTVKWIPFLLLIAVFSYYSVYIGYRALYRKQIHQGKGVTWFDWMAVSMAGLFNISFLVWGMYHVVTGQTAFGLLSAGFGSGGLIIVYNELKSYIKPPADKFSWFYRHIGSCWVGLLLRLRLFQHKSFILCQG